MQGCYYKFGKKNYASKETLRSPAHIQLPDTILSLQLILGIVLNRPTIQSPPTQYYTTQINVLL